jgi:NADH-quinone oxidoreductase subunit C
MTDLFSQLHDVFPNVTHAHDEITLEIPASEAFGVCRKLRDEFGFDMLVDVCGVDYLLYGLAEWATADSTSQGFDRAVSRDEKIRVIPWHKPRFAIVTHLLSLKKNQRLRVRVFAEEVNGRWQVDSLTNLWSSANWFEREAFDLFGIVFKGHPDLRRILTDYGFVGHPFRKDFPISGHVEVRYDADKKQVIYEPVDIEPRVLVPKVIRQDHRYESKEGRDG